MKEQGHISKVLITGASGFIGGHVVTRFCNEGFEVTCLVRNNSNLSFIEKLPINLVYGNVTDLAGLEKACREMDAVIHLAGKVSDWGDYKEFYETNVLGTLNVLSACTTNNIKNVVITGSISSYGEEHSLEVKSEASTYNSHYTYFMDKVFPCKMNHYRDTKALATKEAIKFAGANEINLSIIEPVWVYGENEFNTGFYEYLKSVKSGDKFLPGSKKNKFHVVYVHDLARAYFLAFNKEFKGVHRFIIGNKEVIHMEQIYSLFCEKAGLRKPKNLPKAIIYPIGFLMELFATLLSAKQAPLLTRGRVNMFYDNIEYATNKAEQLLGFTNDFSLEQGIEKTVEWYKLNDLI